MKIKIVLTMLLFGANLFAQEQIKLDNLNDFDQQAGNWQIVGEVTVNRNIDVHELEKHELEAKSKKKKKRKRKSENQVIPKPIDFKPGSGILLNINDSEKRDPLKTVWEHGDIKLELEVMLPKGSNSGIYLQGRYELQLKDSWGVVSPKMSDMGGIHNNWETTPDKIFRGIPPLSNASKAPGLWQKLKIHFQAPRFNTLGEKIANAKFVSVTLNGVAIHTNVEVPHYTGGPIAKNEVAKGPLMIQGDHGPVAFRDIKYQLLEPSGVTVSSLKYKTYKGNFKGLEELNEAKIVSEGQAKLIDVNVTGEEDGYGVVYSGVLSIPKNNTYTVSVGYSGGMSLEINGKSVILKNASDREESLDVTLELSAGTHSFLLTNIKSAAWRAPRLGFSISTAATNPKAFNVYDSYPNAVNSVSPIFVQPNARPRMLRAFVGFKGNGKRLSHTIGVGMPEGVNYVYDLGAGNLVGVWRGDFVDATPMWHSRGDGSFRPRGAVQWTFLNQPIAQLSNFKDGFPVTGSAPDFVSKGYAVDKVTGLPVFKYVYKDVEIESSITPSDNTHIIHTIQFSKSGLVNWYCKLASGTVKKMPDGSYAIDDQKYFVKVLTGQIPIIREIEGETELVIPVDGSTVKYEIIW
ncbi:family 16 glycoside hydrolase [Snuella sedimenti]|uniref:DUF1080 domain-containing protein n=1 Tax=Snuella sedimenti TaxID=2798802 RepID=A0A8J7J0C2_9FLAO|nr:family 16 glycoside hydrolase [Snuella sedimenti]MBJ6366674.1 DUF1080 domain-containing protein [Snuella sedimenti]